MATMINLHGGPVDGKAVGIDSRYLDTIDTIIVPVEDEVTGFTHVYLLKKGGRNADYEKSERKFKNLKLIVWGWQTHNA